MARIVKNGVTYSQDTTSLATALTNGSTTIEQTNGVLNAKTSGVATSLVNGSSTLTQTSGVMEVSAAYVRGDTSTGGTTSGIFRIFSGTADPATLSSLGQNGDIYLYRTNS